MLYQIEDEEEIIRKIKILKNLDQTGKLQTKVIVHEKLNFNELTSQISKKLQFQQLKNLRLFTSDGVEIFQEDLKYIQNGKKLYASSGEEFDTSTCINQYKKLKILGQGGYGKVLLVQHKITKEKAAIKFINTQQISNAVDIDNLFKEAHILKNLHHQNIVQIYNCYTLPDMQVVMIMEYLEGGDLAQYLQEHGKLDEYSAKKFFLQILDAINYCHKNKLIHRDLKLENIMISKQGSTIIKLVDFGIAGSLTNINLEQINVGSLRYMSPEVLSNHISKLSPSIDIWAMGIILFTLVIGDLPFKGRTKQGITDSIIYKDFDYPVKKEKFLSQEFKDLMEQILEKNPESRITLKALQNHPWVKKDQLTFQFKPIKIQQKIEELNQPSNLSDDNQSQDEDEGNENDDPINTSIDLKKRGSRGSKQLIPSPSQKSINSKQNISSQNDIIKTINSGVQITNTNLKKILKPHPPTNDQNSEQKSPQKSIFFKANDQKIYANNSPNFKNIQNISPIQKPGNSSPKPRKIDFNQALFQDHRTLKKINNLILQEEQNFYDLKIRQQQMQQKLRAYYSRTPSPEQKRFNSEKLKHLRSQQQTQQTDRSTYNRQIKTPRQPSPKQEINSTPKNLNNISNSQRNNNANNQNIFSTLVNQPSNTSNDNNNNEISEVKKVSTLGRFFKKQKISEQNQNPVIQNEIVNTEMVSNQKLNQPIKIQYLIEKPQPNNNKPLPNIFQNEKYTKNTNILSIPPQQQQQQNFFLGAVKQ